MNATELLLPDGRPSGVYYCETCRYVTNERDIAESCCKPKTCKECGQDMPAKTHYTICDRCRYTRWIASTHELLESAQEVTNYYSWVYYEDHGPQNGYFNSVESLVEYCEDHELDIPEFVFCCEPSRFFVDPEKVIECAEQQIELDCCEDYVPEYKGVKEFAEACEKFTEANQHVCTYWVDTKRKVRVRKFETSI